MTTWVWQIGGTFLSKRMGQYKLQSSHPHPEPIHTTTVTAASIVTTIILLFINAVPLRTATGSCTATEHVAPSRGTKHGGRGILHSNRERCMIKRTWRHSDRRWECPSIVSESPPLPSTPPFSLFWSPETADARAVSFFHLLWPRARLW